MGSILQLCMLYLLDLRCKFIFSFLCCCLLGLYCLRQLYFHCRYLQEVCSYWPVHIRYSCLLPICSMCRFSLLCWCLLGLCCQRLLYFSLTCMLHIFYFDVTFFISALFCSYVYVTYILCVCCIYFISADFCPYVHVTCILCLLFFSHVYVTYILVLCYINFISAIFSLKCMLHIFYFYVSYVYFCSTLLLHVCFPALFCSSACRAYFY